MSQTSFFTESDFHVFNIDGLEPRMEALKRQIRPKFEQIGQEIAPFLSLHLNDEVTVHTAKHARRTVNPPEETWVAWSTSKRGYKKYPHFQLGLRDLHLFIWFALIYECNQKALFARHIKQQLSEVWTPIPNHFYISQDHTKLDAVQKKELHMNQIHHILDRLESVKKAEFLCGTLISRQEAVTLSLSELVQRVESTFETVIPLYQLARRDRLEP